MTGADFVKLWLSGTTCSGWIPSRGGDLRKLLWEDDTYVLVRHASHKTYVDRMAGSRTCEAYTELYRKDRAVSDVKTGDGPIRRWEGGRWNRVKLAEALATVAGLRTGLPGPVSGPAGTDTPGSPS